VPEIILALGMRECKPRETARGGRGAASVERIGMPHPRPDDVPPRPTGRLVVTLAARQADRVAARWRGGALALLPASEGLADAAGCWCFGPAPAQPAGL